MSEAKGKADASNSAGIAMKRISIGLSLLRAGKEPEIICRASLSRLETAGPWDKPLPQRTAGF